MAIPSIPKGDVAREAVHALRGYVYQIYQSAMSWLDLQTDHVLYLEIAEDFAIAASNALSAVQVKDTKSSVTLMSKGVLDCIDNFVRLCDENPERDVCMRYLTTSKIGTEKSSKNRLGAEPALETWQRCARAGDVTEFRDLLLRIGISERTKEFIEQRSDEEFRLQILRKIRFDCGALGSIEIRRVLKERMLRRLREYGGVPSQLDAAVNDVIVTLLEKASSPEDRKVDRLALEEIIEKATHITINKSQYEAQIRLASGAVAAAVTGNSTLQGLQTNLPTPIDALLLPRAVANRTPIIDGAITAVEQHGIAWLYGAAGSGKTVLAKLAARKLGSNWALVNLRGYSAEQSRQVLEGVARQLQDAEFEGIVLDDFDQVANPQAIAGLQYLRAIITHLHMALAVTSSRPIGPTLLFDFGLPALVNQKVGDFSVEDVGEVLELLGVEKEPWAQLIHLTSGGGHPQLVAASIQSMANRDWDLTEVGTMSALFTGNEEIEAVRRETRERLLQELPKTARKLLERLSLKLGSFGRDFVVEVAALDIRIDDGGIIFDQLLGSWIDQQDTDKFALSPLLSGFAAKVLSETEKQRYHNSFADILLDTQTLDPVQANSALFSALNGENTGAIAGLCLSLLREDTETLEMIAPFLTVITQLDATEPAYQTDPHVGQVLRGAQLILLSHQKSSFTDFGKSLAAFRRETNNVENVVMRNSMKSLVYTKLLLSSPKFGALPRFWEMIDELDKFFRDEAEELPAAIRNGFAGNNSAETRPDSFMLVSQASMLRRISDLLDLFRYLANCSEDRRNILLSVFAKPEFDIDMLVTGAWMSEHKAETIDATAHAEVFRVLEQVSRDWTPVGIAVSCRKYRAIIIDEYGGERKDALAVLDEGLEVYGVTNSELIRAKAKVLHRAGEHAESLELSRQLIQGGANFAETEKAFLGRDAAVSAERQGDFETAREFYLFGSTAAGKCSSEEMEPMRIGLLADAALASWHAGDRAACLMDYVAVLSELQKLEVGTSLRAAHCHATIRHVLLWMQQSASGEALLLPDGSETRIYPGVMSNPEPHPTIIDRPRTCPEVAWYMLASVENYLDLDVGISNQLERFLINGPVVAGQQLLSSSKMHRSIATLNTDLFFRTLRDTMSEFAFSKTHGVHSAFDIMNPTFEPVPPATIDQLKEMSDLAGYFVLCFASAAALADKKDVFTVFTNRLAGASGFRLKDDLVASLNDGAVPSDFSTAHACRLFEIVNSDEKVGSLTPVEVFETAYRTMEVAKQSANRRSLGPTMLSWLELHWAYIWSRQRFRLKDPSFHEAEMDLALKNITHPWDKASSIMLHMLPMLGLTNENDLRSSIQEFPF